MFSIKLENDDVQDFDFRWEEALLLTSDLPSDKVLGGLFVSKLQDSSQAQTTMALHNQEILRGGGKRDYHRLRMCVTLHVEQAQKRNQDSEQDFRACCRNKERDKILSPSGRQESAFSGRQMGLVHKETLVVFYIRVPRETERHLLTPAVKGKGQASSSGLGTDVFMATSVCIDMLMVRRSPATSRRKRVLKKQLRF